MIEIFSEKSFAFMDAAANGLDILLIAVQA